MKSMVDSKQKSFIDSSTQRQEEVTQLFRTRKKPMLMAKLNELNETLKQCDLPNGVEVLSEDKLPVANDDGISIHELTVIKKTEEKNMQTDLQMIDIASAISKGADMCGFIAPLNVFDESEYDASDVSSSLSENQVDISSFRSNNTMFIAYTVDILASDGQGILYSSEDSNLLVYQYCDKEFETTSAWYHSSIVDMIWCSNVNAYLCSTLDGIYIVRFNLRNYAVFRVTFCDINSWEEIRTIMLGSCDKDEEVEIRSDTNGNLFISSGLNMLWIVKETGKKCSGIDDNDTHYPMHDPKLLVNVLNCVNSIKKRVLEEPTTPIPQIYDQQVKKFRRENGSAATVPVFDSIRQSLYSTRLSVFPLLPKTLQSLVIPQQMACFYSMASLEILGKSQHWNADGTFRTAPKIFYQSYSIHTWDKLSMKPIVHAALPNKNEASYEILLDRLLSYATQQNVALNPQSILIDFQVASWNAFSHKFPTAMVKGCHFHFAQNKWKKIRKYSLAKLILNTDNSRRQLAKLMAPTEVNEAFSSLIELFSELGDKCIKLTDYVLKTPRTNNHVGGYHRQLNSHCEIHPHLWAWIHYIQESEESTMSRYEQERAQQRITRPRKRRTVNNDLRLTEAKKNYFNGRLDLEDYQAILRSLSYRYIVVLDNDSNSKDDDKYEPKI
ncbi:unnamed protein product [Didymodactylos carnosus]|uniref:MULE transposase domain-containing protein n=1 Tax=Didymodactylos carnosus TaxID=1234261 RepID=A0A8S2K7D5_9BILA|nr:unnamed protein product [Didymodactylos carnosus]CAF3840669.1 unnamed protein product [Didymodactylos carnosus]